ncbi:MAG: hypothetical protein ABUL64_04100 [Singulisphaera sp.]
MQPGELSDETQRIGARPGEVNGRAISFVLVAATCFMAIWGACRAWNLGDRLLADEPVVLGQVKLFLAGKLELLGEFEYPAAAMLPGFQAVLTVVAAPLGSTSPSILRLYCFGLSLAYPLVVFAIARQLMSDDQALWRAAQAYVLPIVFPFNTLLYTDLFSLTVNLAALWACMRRSYVAAGLVMLLALCVRQTNVVFILFLCGFSYVEVNGAQITWRRIFSHVRRCWLLLGGIFAFIVFVVVHGRVGLDDPHHHPLSFGFGNLLFCVLTGGVVFLPLLVRHAADILRWAVKNRLETVVTTVLTAGIAFTYGITHPWNLSAGYLRNYFMLYVLPSNLLRGVSALFGSLTILSLLARGLSRPSALMLYVYSFLSLAPVALIEPRYYFGPLLLYQLFRKVETPSVEFALWCWFAAWAVGLEHLVTATDIFL